MIREWFKENKLVFHSIRIVIVYAIFLMVAKYTYIFSMGLVPKDFIGMLILAGVIFYRLLAIALAPALLTIWLVRNYVFKEGK